jgi:hypothetical protein
VSSIVSQQSQYRLEQALELSRFTASNWKRGKMTLFFYNLISGEDLDEGTVGLSLPNVDAAKSEAIRAARELVIERVDLSLPIDRQAFEVCDEDGALIFRLEFRQALHS